MSERDDTSMTYSSGNVFADMGLPNPEELLLKAKLARFINKAIEEKSWTQKEAAKVLGITQPKIADLGRGRLKNFSVYRLLGFLARLDYRVAITVSGPDLPPEEFVIAADSLAEEQVMNYG